MNSPSLFLALFAVLTWQCSAAEPRTQSDSGSAAAPAGALFGPRATELLTLLQQRQLVMPLDPAVDRAVGEALLRYVGCGARYAPPGPETTPPRATTALLRTRYFYCWLPTLTPVTAADLTKALATGDAGNTAVGLIVDLRGAAQGTPDGVAGLVALLSGQAKPLVLLLNQETAGPAEILAVLLRHNAGATWIGQKTRGCFAFSEPVTLATGDTLLLPRTIREFAGVGLPAEALAPDVAVESGPAGENQAGLTAERFETFPDRDAALRAAVDMLTTIHALTAKESAAPARKP